MPYVIGMKQGKRVENEKCIDVFMKHENDMENENENELKHECEHERKYVMNT